MFKKLIFILFSAFVQLAMAQNNTKVVAGPMLAYTELRTATIWLEVNTPNPKSISIYFEPTNKNIPIKKVTDIKSTNNLLGNFIIHATLTDLHPSLTYNYYIYQNKQLLSKGSVTTQSLWQWRQNPQDFSFLAGSCAYFNDSAYDRPGKPYGASDSIFLTMAKENANFMLWLGDNWYTREADYFSSWGLNYRASKDRSTKNLQPLLSKMAHYAIWDDHDYGCDNADKTFALKQTSLDVFKQYWPNVTYGENNQGIYNKFSWNDIDIFLLDCRWFRSNDLLPDSVDGRPNARKQMFGAQQMEWLKNALLLSAANNATSFRIIVNGSQILNPLSNVDCLYHFPAEYQELLQFIDDNKISGVVFLSGDRHHSEIIELKRQNNYPLYDITLSSLTAGISRSKGKEVNHPNRIGSEIAQNNYGKLSFSGAGKNRTLSVDVFNAHGNKLMNWHVSLQQLTNP